MVGSTGKLASSTELDTSLTFGDVAGVDQAKSQVQVRCTYPPPAPHPHPPTHRQSLVSFVMSQPPHTPDHAKPANSDTPQFFLLPQDSRVAAAAVNLKFRFMSSPARAPHDRMHACMHHLHRARRLPFLRAGACVDDQEPRTIHRRGGSVAERALDGRPPRYGQDPHGQSHGSRGRRSGGSLLLSSLL